MKFQKYITGVDYKAQARCSVRVVLLLATEDTDGKMNKAIFSVFFLFVVSHVFQVDCMPEPGAGGAVAGTLIAEIGMEALNDLISNLGESETSNGAGSCIWNDWYSRDLQATIHRVYNNCR